MDLGEQSLRKLAAGCLVVLLIVGCSSVTVRPGAAVATAKPTPATAKVMAAPLLPQAGSGRGGYYKDDGPGERIPLGLEQTPDAEPKIEPYSLRANRPYSVFGNSYLPITDNRPFIQRGIGSWYGKKFHGQKTSSGELYDMYKMTAAHPTLPIPSYSRVTNLDNGKQIIVRINDRGPFHSNRIIDLSYTAALKLGYLGKGSGMLEVEHLPPEKIASIAQSARIRGGSEPALVAAQVQRNSEGSGAVQYPPLPSELLTDSSEKPAQASQTLASYYIQLGSFAQAHNAEAMRAQYALSWKDKLPPAELVQKGEYHRLYVGPFDTREKAENAAQQLRGDGKSKPVIVQL